MRTQPACFEQIFPGLAVSQLLQGRLLGSVEQRDQPAIAQSLIRRRPGSRIQFGLAQAIKLMRIIHHQPTRFIGGQQTLVKLAGERRRLGIDRLQGLFFRLSQPGTGEDKALVQLLDQAKRLRVWRHRLPRLVNCIHPGKEGVIQPDIIGQRRQLGGDRLFQLLQIIIGVRRGHGKENIAHPAQQAAAVLQRQHGIVKVRCCRRPGDGCDLVAFLANGFVKGRAIVTVVNQIKMRRLVR